MSRKIAAPCLLLATALVATGCFGNAKDDSAGPANDEPPAAFDENGETNGEPNWWKFNRESSDGTVRGYGKSRVAGQVTSAAQARLTQQARADAIVDVSRRINAAVSLALEDLTQDGMIENESEVLKRAGGSAVSASISGFTIKRQGLNRDRSAFFLVGSIESESVDKIVSEVAVKPEIAEALSKRKVEDDAFAAAVKAKLFGNPKAK